MKNQLLHRMPKTAHKDAADNGDKPPGRKQPATNSKKKGRAPPPDDDESVDSRGNIRGLIAYTSESDDESAPESDDTGLTPEQKTEIRRVARKAALKAREKIQRQTRAKGKKFAPKKKVVESESEEEEEDEYEDGHPGISISIGGFGGEESFAERMVPKRHNMKKESDVVKKFVDLISKPPEDNTIDDQIDQFKTLASEKQAQLITALERKPVNDASQNLMFHILTMGLPPDTQSMVLAKYNSLQSLDPGAGEYFKMRAWLEKLTSLPLGIYKDIPVRIGDGTDACAAFMNRASKCLSEAIYGQEESKLQILQFIAGKIANPSASGMSLMLAGPPGIGKTSIIRNGIAKALNWPFQFISLGGDSDASTYTGHQLVYESSHCGKIVNSLIAAKSMSMVLMFDEVDKISATPKGEEVQNLLIHLTDSVQNADFEDKYLSGVPLDLSKVMFAFSGNDLGKIDRVLLDRMMVVNLQGYSSKEKLAIAENFIVPQALKEVNLDEKVSVPKEVLQHLIETYAKDESGVRELKRCVEQITQKVNMLRIFNTKDLPFHIPNFHLPFVVKKEHVEMFLKKKPVNDSIAHLYA